MRMHRTIAALALTLAATLAMQASQAAATLRPYRDESELASALERWRQASQKAAPARALLQAGAALQLAAPAPATTAADAERSADGITNLQTAGVDEGGIVKRAGEHLVILRRGRLFTVRVGADRLQAVAQIDAFAPGTDPRGAWYDELLISGSTVVVVGYSYARGGTEIGLFDLASDGSLAYRATHHLRSFDYYSARNYASRLIGQQLVFYAPTLLQPWGPDWAGMMPALRRSGGQVQPSAFERILPATRVYRIDDEFEPGQPLALHTVTRCDLGAPQLRCEAAAVLGPAGRVFYVSAGSVYVWTQAVRRATAPAGGRDEGPDSMASLFRLPLDGAAPTGIKTVGVPTDQLSFLEDAQGHLNVLLRESGSGEGMAGAQRSRGRTALLRLPLSALGDGRGVAAHEHYRRLPGSDRSGLQNRFVGDWLLWGAGEAAWALRYAAPAAVVTLDPGHDVERIEPLGENALLVGNAGADLHFSAVRLARHSARLEGRFQQASTRQGETRSHGFFYRATGADEGLLGLPVINTDTTGRAALSGRSEGAASVVLLRRRGPSFSGLGELSARPGPRPDDRCRASCVDWYGNARPIFIGERVLALMGYELVEGQLQGSGRQERIEERRRLDFSPRVKPLLPMRPTPFD